MSKRDLPTLEVFTGQPKSSKQQLFVSKASSNVISPKLAANSGSNLKLRTAGSGHIVSQSKQHSSQHSFKKNMTIQSNSSKSSMQLRVGQQQHKNNATVTNSKQRNSVTGNGLIPGTATIGLSHQKVRNSSPKHSLKEKDAKVAKSFAQTI